VGDNNFSSCQKVQNGDFLVATVISPEYIDAMERTSAVITDEGGVLRMQQLSPEG
jgi:phosphohistidine swiveling domain-containing protein